MAVNIQAELERIYNEGKSRETGLTDRLNAIDRYAGQVNPVVRAQMLDSSTRPVGYNPLDDLAAAVNFSENSRDIRARAQGEYDSTRQNNLSLLSQLNTLAQQGAGSLGSSPEDKLTQQIKLEAAKQAIKDGQLRLDKDGNLVIDNKPKVSEGKQEILDVANQLLGENTKPITGVLQLESLVPGTHAKRTEAVYNQLKGLLSLDNRSKLKGSGAISDFEARTLERAASSLDRNMSDDDFRKTLKELRDKLAGNTPSASKTSGKYVIEEVE